MVDGLQCAACVWLIETVLRREPGVTHARLNMTTRRLTVTWDPALNDAADGHRLRSSGLGYRLVPFDPEKLDAAEAVRERELLRALGVAGFSAANVMLLSVAIWAGHSQGMGPATRDLLHWVSALIAMPAILYAARAVLPLRLERPEVAAHQHGRADFDRRDAGDRHEPRRDDPGRRARLFRQRDHAAVLPADRPLSGYAGTGPGAFRRRAPAVPQRLRRHRARRRRSAAASFAPSR